MSQLWTVQRTADAYSGAIPESAWYTHSTHSTRTLAAREYERVLAARDRRCGPRSWDSHQRIAALPGAVVTAQEIDADAAMHHTCCGAVWTNIEVAS